MELYYNKFDVVCTDAKVEWKAPINSRVALFDCATPGTLPKLNSQCVKLAILAARATNCNLASKLIFDRKHYEHWDLPAGYQITQKRLPLATGGAITIDQNRKIKIKQIHLEQDSGKSYNVNGKMVVDLNRVGVGLIELVSEPEITNPKDASVFAQRVHELFQDLKVCNGNLEQGAMRIDVNVNLVNEETGAPVTPRVELKNINGIGVIESAVSAELRRQENLLKQENSLASETRFYSPETDETILLRTKDASESYRYLPEYDIPAYDIETFIDLQNIPLTRHERIQKYQELYPQLQGTDLLRLWTRAESLPSLFEDCLPFVKDKRFFLNWCLGELLAIINRENIETIAFTPENFANLVECVKSGKLDKEIAKKEMLAALKEHRDLSIRDSPKTGTDLDAAINREIDDLFMLHADRIAFLKSPEGQKRGSVDFFIGPLMKKFRGQVTAVELTILLKNRLNQIK